VQTNRGFEKKKGGPKRIHSLKKRANNARDFGKTKEGGTRHPGDNSPANGKPTKKKKKKKNTNGGACQLLFPPGPSPARQSQAQSKKRGEKVTKEQTGKKQSPKRLTKNGTQKK